MTQPACQCASLHSREPVKPQHSNITALKNLFIVQPNVPSSPSRVRVHPEAGSIDEELVQISKGFRQLANNDQSKAKVQNMEGEGIN